MKARVFNIMQYRKHPETGELLLTEERIRQALAHKTIKQWAYILHDKDVYSQADEEQNPNHVQGQPKPPHWHIVVQMGTNQCEIGVIAKWFGIADNFVDVPKGSGAGKFLDCVEYLTHESVRQQELGKFRYEDKAVKSSEGFAWRASLDKRNENKLKYGKDLSNLEQIKFDVLYGGKTLRQCMAQDRLLYMDCYEKLQKLRMQYIAGLKPPKTRLNYYVCGKGGYGKGLICRALARSMYPQYEDDEDIFFEVGAKGVAFEGYDGQPVIIWNDRRAIDLLQELNGRGNVFNVFDTHPTRQRQNVKYSSVNLCNEVNIVNSVQPYDEFLDGLAGEYVDKNGARFEAEDKSQSYRRFPFMIILHEEDFDMMINKGFMQNTREFEEYNMYQHIRGNMQKISEICGPDEKLIRELEARTVQPVIDKHNEIKSQFEKTSIDRDAVMNEFANYGKMASEISSEPKNEDDDYELPF